MKPLIQVVLLTLLLYQFGLVTSAGTFTVVRQAPFCVDEDLVEVKNFKPIFDYHNANPKQFVPVSPDTYRSPTGFIQNVTLSRISIAAIRDTHPYKVFQNYFHMSIVTANLSDGMEGLYVQAIASPLGVPIGEFVIDFDCGDCTYPTSAYKEHMDIVPCQYRPAASYLHPLVFTLGGKNAPRKFKEAHFNFRYVDYPCYDVTFAQFLIIAVRSFQPLHYETFYSSLYHVNIEGVGAPFPMYYGWTPNDIQCHLEDHTPITTNWIAQKNQKAKVRYNMQYDKCSVEGVSETTAPFLAPGIICPPGPVTCTTEAKNPPTTVSQWKGIRDGYSSKNNKEGGTETFCFDCGTWEDRIGESKWPRPPIIVIEVEEIDENEAPVTRKPYVKRPRPPGPNRVEECEEREGPHGKNSSGGRDPSKRKICAEQDDFDFRLADIGWKWGQVALKIHGVILIFAFTVASNCLFYCARFLKEATIINKATGCFGIGWWLWEHIFWTYVGIAAIWASCFMYALLPEVEPVCYLYDDKEDTERCIDSNDIHKIVGGSAVVLFHMGFLSGWVRPISSAVRVPLILYHVACGYIAKYLGLLCLLSVLHSFNNQVKVVLFLSELTFWLLFAVATCMQRVIDSKLRVQRRMCPVPQGIDTFYDAPMHTMQILMFTLLAIVQAGVFGVLCYVYF